MARKLALGLLVVACAAVLVAYQVTRPAKASGAARAFVPSPQFYLDFSPSFRTTVAHVYWLQTVQYYGEHVTGDGRLEALPEMLDLVSTLSPKFRRVYTFGSYALVDAGRADKGYELLLRGVENLPDDWWLKTTLGAFIYQFASDDDKAELAAEWYRKAAAMPGARPWVSRVAARLTAKGGDAEKAALLWAQVYDQGDEYSRQKAVAALDELLPKDKQARMKAVAPLGQMMLPGRFEQLIAELFRGY